MSYQDFVANPVLSVDRIVNGLNQDISVKGITQECIKAVKSDFQSFFPLEQDRLNIPSLSAQNLEHLNGKLVRFFGLVVDESQEDLYYMPLHLNSDGNWVNIGILREPEWFNDNAYEGSSMDNLSSLMPRKTIKVLSIPGLSTSIIDELSIFNIDPLEVVLYDLKDFETCRIGKSFEFYGILSISNEESTASHSLHLVSAISYKYFSNRRLFSNYRIQIIDYLTDCFGDKASATLILANLISSITERQNGLLTSLLIGNFPLNIILDLSMNSSDLVSLLSKLCPALVKIDVNSKFLDQCILNPIVNNEDGSLMCGKLQLSQGTHVVLDETTLEQCQLTEKATKNLNALIKLLDHQQIDIDFDFQTVSIGTDYPIIGISNGKSILSYPWSIKPSKLQISDLDSDILYNWQTFLIKCRECSVTIPSDVSKLIEADYAIRRSQQPKEFDENSLSTVLNLSKLISKSCMASELTLEHWQEALFIFDSHSKKQ